MNNNGKYITVSEASHLTGKHITTIYKGIRQGRIQYKTVEDGYKPVKKVLKSDIVSLYNDGSYTGIRPSNTEVEDGIRPPYTKVEDDLIPSNTLKEDIRQVIEEYFQEKETSLIKPLEQQAIYRAGELNKENQFLKARLETILEENQTLREAMKALPGPVEEISTKLATLEKIKLEKNELQSRIQTEEKQKEKINKEKQEALQIAQDKEQALQQKEKAIKELQIEKETAITEKEQLLTVAERELNEIKIKAEQLQTQKEQETQEYQKKIEEKEREEKDLLATVNALKERLEAEEQKSWWQKLWG